MGPSSKRRKISSVGRVAPVEEITFDTSARQEFLTGFHKRKVQRAKHAADIAEKRAREERREFRKKIREERKAEFERAVEIHRAQMEELNASSGDEDDKSGEEDGEEWNGIAEPEPVDYEAEYVDEDKYTTVTVEEIDLAKGRGLGDENESESEQSGDEGKGEGGDSQSKKDGETKKRRIWTKENPNPTKKRKKKRNFKYESRDERKVSRAKERAKNSKQAKERRGK